VQPTASEVGNFFSLLPEHVLAAVEQAGKHTTGLCYALNSLENRVYEVELEEGRRLVAKFYRPQRWSRETILGEHQLLRALADAEIPVCPPEVFPDGQTLHLAAEGILFALFPRVGGRSPDELNLDEHEELGRLLARIHNVSANLKGHARPELSAETYGRQSLAVILAKTAMPDGLRHRYADTVGRVIDVAERRLSGVDRFLTHSDCHRGNLLRGSAGLFFLDFDDAAVGPAVQDFWLLLPARPNDCPRELEAMLKGYETFRDFPHTSLRLIEPLRALRYVRYAGWVAARWEDPAFKRAFPHWGTDNYWEAQLADLMEQLRIFEVEEAAD
jgi:Ser/Thr protein kinase RdoA (MazF antagonist)